ncbi:MAG: tetratricopeptide repeat protein [Halodesulfovibrio sp.]
MASNISMKMKQKQYEGHVVDYVTVSKGYFLIVSEDNNFQSILRGTVQKHLAITEDCMSVVSNPDHILKAIKDTSMRRKSILVFIERTLQGKDMGFLVRQLKNAFDFVKIIILTGEADRHKLVLLHEIGADNFITKPISINTLIEKIAFTIKPQGKLGQLIDLAKSMVTRGAYDQALKASRKILEIKPNSAAGFLVMGDAFKGLGKLDKAREAYESASDNAQLYLEPLKKLADLHKETGDVDQQLKYLERLDKLSPLNVERKVDMGTIHVELGNEEEAEKLFNSAVNQATREALSYIGEISERIGHVYSQRDPVRAEQYYRRALDAKGDMLEKSDIATFNSLGIALRKQGKWYEATQEYEKALRIAPDDEHLFYNAAMACAEGKQFRTSAEHLESALGINADFPRRDKTIAFNMGVVYMRVGNKNRAKEMLEITLELEPDFAKAREMLSQMQ